MSRVRFGPFEADAASGELFRDGTAIPIQDLPFRLLTALLQRPGEVVTRAELSAALWGSDTYVDATAGLNTAVAKLRDALGDDPDAPVYIETVPKRGYRFIAAVERSKENESRTERQASTDRQVAVEHRPFDRALKARFVWLAAAAAVIVVVGLAYQLRADRPKVRVAVTVFDNETGDQRFDRMSQGLTDATVFALTAEPPLAVIGNAAVLRTTRPFRDLSTIHDALNTDFIIVGQVQRVDETVIVRTHLIRSADQSHVWVAVTNLTDEGEAALQTAVAGRVTAAVKKYALGR